jgi:hypothetical protein
MHEVMTPGYMRQILRFAVLIDGWICEDLIFCFMPHNSVVLVAMRIVVSPSNMVLLLSVLSALSGKHRVQSFLASQSLVHRGRLLSLNAKGT